jgi:hypothetical protein
MNKELINELEKCAAECDECYRACLEEADVDQLQHCMMLNQECYDMCELTARMLEQGSPRKDKYVQLCAEVCMACKEECEKHIHRHCHMCAEECHKCAEMCRGIVMS